MADTIFDLTGKTALVTGASSGLGLDFARILAGAGARVVLAARRKEALDEICGQMGGAGLDVAAMRLDVTDADSVGAAFEQHCPDIVVNNAGSAISKPALTISAAEWDSLLDTNLKGAFLVAQAAAQNLKDAAKPGSIINISSILGLRVASHVAPYAASKAGLVQLTRALALEWARYGVRVNAICPGYIETSLNRDFFQTDAGKALVKRIPQRRLGTTGDLAGPLLLLASDAGAYMTGSVIAADGGHLVSSL